MNLEYETKISSLLEHIRNFEEINKKEKQTETDIKYGVPMMLFQIINYTIDLADILISGKRLGYPTKYSDSFEFLFVFIIV